MFTKPCYSQYGVGSHVHALLPQDTCRFDCCKAWIFFWKSIISGTLPACHGEGRFQEALRCIFITFGNLCYDLRWFASRAQQLCSVIWMNGSEVEPQTVNGTMNRPELCQLCIVTLSVGSAATTPPTSGNVTLHALSWQRRLFASFCGRKTNSWFHFSQSLSGFWSKHWRCTIDATQSLIVKEHFHSVSCLSRGGCFVFGLLISCHWLLVSPVLTTLVVALVEYVSQCCSVSDSIQRVVNVLCHWKHFFILNIDTHTHTHTPNSFLSIDCCAKLRQPHWLLSFAANILLNLCCLYYYI